MSTFATSAHGEFPLFVDITPVMEKHLTGIGRFVLRLVESMARRCSMRLFSDVFEGTIRVGQDDFADVDEGVYRWRSRIMSAPRLPVGPDVEAQSTGIYTAWRPSRRRFGRELGILYDFTSSLLPWAHSPKTCDAFGRSFEQQIALSDDLLAISECTKKDAQWLHDQGGPEVVVGYPGPSQCVNRHASIRRVDRRENLILVVSTVEPRKNAPFLVDWFRSTRILSSDFALCWVGPKGWWSTDTPFDLLRRRGNKQRRLQFRGMVSDRVLCELYRQAKFTIYPSLYEGFGFPVLDSLLHGTPVACSFNSSLQEFACEGIHYFDPCDRCSLDRACAEALGRGQEGIDQAGLRDKYCWNKLGDRILAVCA